MALLAPLLAACTSSDKPAAPAPLPSGRALDSLDVCASLLSPSALSALETSGIRAAGAPRPVVVPFTAPGATESVSTEGCEVRLDGGPLEGAVVRRVLDADAISQLRKGVKLTTDKLAGGPNGWELRWSDAASTSFALRDGDSALQEAYIVQLVLQRAGVDRKLAVRRLTTAVLEGGAS